eukprot:CAMPEP_0184520282 /NCGR_PEP_ID=MMETSP0198_2-20121128/7079_1 /TAXON_ID=1112570 /ORGANISM="Thraustochytrium sp., Strain LLF1b" /LENGTH=174 /DNA_ID=CAMNT_0026910859 /DNA_START=261 /DNA_END=782 /DNA_ORIENTATION=-
MASEDEAVMREFTQPRRRQTGFNYMTTYLSNPEVPLHKRKVLWFSVGLYAALISGVLALTASFFFSSVDIPDSPTFDVLGSGGQQCGYLFEDCPDFEVNPPTVEETSFPTKAPTSSPTSAPTGPTAEPTTNPTKGPTRSPTKGPTGSPTTKQPTDSPTNAPSDAPTIGATTLNI